MTTKADYTDEEWEALRRAPMVAGLAVSFADPGGPIELTKESMAARKAIADPPGDEQLLIALSQDAMAHRRESADLKNALDLKARTAPEQIAEELRRVAGIVSEKATPEEADAWRQWMVTAAQDSANAAKEGGFMGFRAERVSEGEQQMLDRLREALAAPPA